MLHQSWWLRVGVIRIRRKRFSALIFRSLSFQLLGLCVVCTRLNQESKLKEAYSANLNKAASVLMVLGWGNEDQEEV